VASRALTPTLAICLAGSITAGIALARPASNGSPVIAAPAVTIPASPPESGPYTGDDAGSPAAPAPAAPAAAAITIAGFDFGAPIVVTPGAQVTVSNGDGVAHTLTGAGGVFDTGAIDRGTAVALVAPTVPGTYEFFCAIHPSMTGSLVVQA
jgi:plastocyanin